MTILDEWIEKAEADYKGAMGLNRRRKEPLPDLVCFHCQQCAEKYLKAFLIAHGFVPPRTHDLQRLLALTTAHDATLAALDADCAALTPYAVDFRYPSSTATVAEAKDAVKTVRRIRTLLRKNLGL